MMRNQRGIITIDFLFAMVLVMGLSMLLFIVSFSLSIASVTQYVTFATARNYAVGHITRANQEQRANAKYKELVGAKTLKPLYSNGWYTVDPAPHLGDHTQKIPALQEAIGTANEFWGASTKFTAKILDFKIPFFGSTAPDGDGTGEGFNVILASYVGREPTEDECIKFTAERWNVIRGLSSGYGQAGSGRYFPMTDDGC